MQIDEDMSLLNNDALLILSNFDFTEPEYLKKPKYKYPPVIFMILDDMIGTNDYILIVVIDLAHSLLVHILYTL